MKSTKSFNNISDKLKASIPTLKPGEVVVFQMLNGIPNPEQDDKERSKSPVLYGKRQLQTNFRIFDPYQKDEAGNEVGGYVDVGVVERWNGDKPDSFRFFTPGLNHGSQFQGKFELRGGVIPDMELFEILFLSNEREGNPHRDPTTEPLFKILDSKAESKVATAKFNKLKKAIEYANGLTNNNVLARAIMAALNQPTYQDKEVLESKVMELATTNPDVFIETYENADTPLKGELKDAVDKNVIRHNLANGEVFVGDVAVTTIKVENIESFIPELARWVNSAENGKDVLENIRRQVKKVSKATA